MRSPAVIYVRQTVERLAAAVYKYDALPCSGRGDGADLDIGKLGVQLFAAADYALAPFRRQKILRVGIGAVAVIGIGEGANTEDLTLLRHQRDSGVAGAEID